MNIFTHAFVMPQSYSTDEITFFPTDDSYYLSDFEAVMQTKDTLRIWSQSSWPEDNFTAVENKADLKHHMDDNIAHTTYGYMIYTLDKKTCLGSVYVNSLTSIPANYQMSTEAQKLLTEFDARIDYWCVNGFDQQITEILFSWFESVWKIKPLFAARNKLDERLQTFSKLGLIKQFDLVSKTSPMTLLLYSR